MGRGRGRGWSRYHRLVLIHADAAVVRRVDRLGHVHGVVPATETFLLKIFFLVSQVTAMETFFIFFVCVCESLVLHGV